MLVLIITAFIAAVAGFAFRWLFPTMNDLETRLLPAAFIVAYFVIIILIYMKNRRQAIAHIYTCTNCNKQWFSIEHSVETVSDHTKPV
jgi:hypothetical protein